MRLGVFAFAGSLLAALAVVWVLGKSWIAHGIVDAPNARVTLRAEADALSEQQRRMGIAEPLRIETTSAGVACSVAVWIVEPQGVPRGTVIVLHGIRSDKTAVLGLAQQVAGEGYRAVLPDLPGQGRSSGDWLTYGVRETGVLTAVLDELARRGRLSGQVGVVGISYGGAVGIQLAARDERVRAVVAVAPFSSLRAVVPSYAEHYLPLLGKQVPNSFIQRGVDEAGVLAGFDPDAASPLKSISQTRAQVLLVHGLSDLLIPSRHSVDLHAAALDHSQLVLLRGEDHFSIATDRTRTIATQGMQWLHRWLDGTRPPNGAPP